MSKPLIAVDLDGTLIDGQGHYSLATRDYFRDLSAQGCIIVLASGRPFRAMKHIYEDLRLTGPSICYNGQLVFDPNDPSFHPVDKRFKAEDIRRVYNDLKPCVEVFMAESANTIYITDEDARLSHFFPSEGMNIVKGDFTDTLNEDVYTCLFKSFDTSDKPFLNAIKGLEGVAWRSWSNATYSELYFPACDKGIALASLVAQLGIDRDDIYAFGDAVNDVSMLELAGHPFGMKNSKVPELLSRFPVTKNPVEEDGVMMTLREVLNR